MTQSHWHFWRQSGDYYEYCDRGSLEQTLYQCRELEHSKLQRQLCQLGQFQNPLLKVSHDTYKRYDYPMNLFFFCDLFDFSRQRENNVETKEEKMK